MALNTYGLGFRVNIPGSDPLFLNKLVLYYNPLHG
uniref:Uncharacterized protein n=1 Tax=Anguilla anguilla TaxID=7936 RepID=A0A0E9QP34_ANGAN